MAGFADKLKSSGFTDKVKSWGNDAKRHAGVAKDKVDVMVDKAGTKVPPKVKHTYDKVSEKAEKVIPGNRKNETEEAGAAAEPDAAVATADAVEDSAIEAAEKAEGIADT